MGTDRIRLQDAQQETEQAKTLAARYRCDFVDLAVERIDHDLFRSIPVDLMFRYNFVPMHAENGLLEIALADPRNLNLIDELAILLNKKLRVKVATLSQISELLKKTEQSQRVLEEVTEGFALGVDLFGQAIGMQVQAVAGLQLTAMALWVSGRAASSDSSLRNAYGLTLLTTILAVGPHLFLQGRSGAWAQGADRAQLLPSPQSRATSSMPFSPPFCIQSSLRLVLLKHGRLRVASDRRHFEHGDGTPRCVPDNWKALVE